jgi:hypothetical protein
MDPNPPPKTSTAFEYFLYAAILAETGLAALIYKFIFESAELVRMRIYFAIFYFAFLGWAIMQLNKLHRDRKTQLAVPPVAAEAAEEKAAARNTRPALGLTAGQLLIVFVVFATAVATFSWALRLVF